MDRRDFIKNATTAGTASILSSCCLIKKPNPNGLFERHIPTDTNSLVDVHAHFFNGTDLQVKEFISRVKGRKRTDWVFIRDLIGGVLQNISWTFAPTAAEELALFQRRLEPEVTLTLRDVQFNRARQATEEAVSAQLAANFDRDTLDFSRNLLDYFPENYDGLMENDEPQMLNLRNEAFDVKGMIHFVVEMFQYRYVSAHNYLSTYNTSNQQTDLAISNLVDYDWFLAQGNPTRSSLQDQVEVMSRVAKLSKGLVHYFVPYCPLRHLAYTKASAAQIANSPGKFFDPMALIDRALHEKGALGVKLYPPMGFALWGNAQLQRENPTLWANKNWLPEICRDPDFGAALDGVLSVFYDYCEKHQVPIMAHSAISNLSDADFSVVYPEEALTELVTSKHRDLIINFGHFGGFGWRNDGNDRDDEDYPSNWEMLADLVRNDAGPQRSKLYVDTGFFARALDDTEQFRQELIALLDSRGYLADRFVYGTDWKMLTSESDSGDYLQAFNRVLTSDNVASLLRQNNAQTIQGDNPIEFLRLRAGDKNRGRMEAFYADSEAPHWFAKFQA